MDGTIKPTGNQLNAARTLGNKMSAALVHQQPATTANEERKMTTKPITTHQNDLTDIPAAACPMCGGWTSQGGMSQHAAKIVQVDGRTGCSCSHGGVRRVSEGDFLQIAFGNGTQLFFVTNITAKGKIWGFRYHVSGCYWFDSSLRANEPRIEEILDATGARAYMRSRTPDVTPVLSIDIFIKDLRKLQQLRDESARKEALYRARLPLLSSDVISWIDSNGMERTNWNKDTWRDRGQEQLDWQVKNTKKLTMQAKRLDQRIAEAARLIESGMGL